VAVLAEEVPAALAEEEAAVLEEVAVEVVDFRAALAEVLHRQQKVLFNIQLQLFFCLHRIVLFTVSSYS
jgi:hypothetical protein